MVCNYDYWVFIDVVMRGYPVEISFLLEEWLNHADICEFIFIVVPALVFVRQSEQILGLDRVLDIDSAF